MKSHEQKITEAAAKNRKYKALESAERIRMVQARRGESKKELMRLIKISIDSNKKTLQLPDPDHIFNK